MSEPEKTVLLSSGTSGDQQRFSDLVEPHRAELQAHCYRMLGSLQDAEDSVQETMTRAWRYLPTFQGRGTIRAWLYRIATNVCLTALDKRARRSLPIMTHPAADPFDPIEPPITDPVWLEPFPGALLSSLTSSPDTQYHLQESIRLAFLVALQTLPGRQRAVLILRDVVGWRAKEVAEMLDTTVSAVNSVLHRARSTLRTRYHPGGIDDANVSPANTTTEALLDQYMQAWEAADVSRLITLLKQDATFSMPPSPTWYRGCEAISFALTHGVFAGGGSSLYRVRATRANAQPAIALYRRHPDAGAYRPYVIQVLSLDGGRIAAIINFKNPDLFRWFDLPSKLDA